MVKPIDLIPVVFKKYFGEASNDSEWEDFKEAIAGIWEDIEEGHNERRSHKSKLKLVYDLVEKAHDEHEKKVFYIDNA